VIKNSYGYIVVIGCPFNILLTSINTKSRTCKCVYLCFGPYIRLFEYLHVSIYVLILISEICLVFPYEDIIISCTFLGVKFHHHRHLQSAEGFGCTGCWSMEFSFLLK